MNNCLKCTTPVSSKCIKWQGKDFYFSKDLEDKYSFEEIEIKISEEIKSVKDDLSIPIDKKGLPIPNEVVKLAHYIQWLIDREALETRESVTKDCETLINIENLGSTSCSGTNVSVNEAFQLLINEINALKERVNLTTSNIYIPNV